MENFLKFVFSMFFVALFSILNGYVFMKLWDWFFVPIFDLNPIRLVEAIGISIVVNFLIARKPSSNKDFWVEFTETISFAISYSVLALFTGWVVSLFM